MEENKKDNKEKADTGKKKHCLNENIKSKGKDIKPFKDTHNLIYLTDKDNLEL